jgi:molecular chaperone GrpE
MSAHENESNPNEPQPSPGDTPEPNTPGAGAKGPPSSPVELALRSQVEQLEAQVNNYKLVLADAHNSSKRLKDDAERHKKYATEGMARDWLSLLDNLERAGQAAQQSSDLGALLAGLQSTINASLDMLKRHGVVKIAVGPGTEFDPNLHMAVAQEPTNDYAAGQVFRVLEAGFLFHDRVLRPAMVVVATEPPAGEATH